MIRFATRFLALLSFITLLILCITAASVKAAQTTSHTSQGVFVDSSGARHLWSVSGTHTLIWDNHPFIPVGGLFQSSYWSLEPTEEAWQSDISALSALKAHGITDIYVQAAPVGLTSVNPAAIQRLLDYLDAEGFTYGISINDGPKDILTGYVVRPGAYRQVAPEGGGSLDFSIDGLASALYFVVTQSGSEVIFSGDATPISKGAQVTVPPIPSTSIVFLVPRKVYFARAVADGGLGLPNLWDGFDTYRDTLIGLFRHVKPGRGFRFIVDPLPPDLTVTGGEIDHLIPSGNGFLSEWEESLTRQYKNIETLEHAWGISDRTVSDFAEAARLLPLWGGGKGIQAFQNPVTGKQLQVETSRSLFWSDLTKYKVLSVHGYMNDLAKILKKTAGDVPVIYRSHGYSPLFAEMPFPDLTYRLTFDFDGIGIEAYGRGGDLVTGSAGYVYAQAAEATRSLWLPVISTADAPPASKTGKGYASALSMHSDLDWLREIGARGFFVYGARVADPKLAAFDLSSSPDQLTWLSDYQRMLVATGVASPETVPKAIFYPRSMISGTLRPLEDGVWWLPTDRAGAVYDFGPAGRAYGLSENGVVVYYLFNPAGTRRVHIKIPKASRLVDGPQVRWSVSAQGELSKKKDTLALTIGPDPVRIENLASLPVPTEAFDEMYNETVKLARTMRAGQDMEAGRFENQLGTIKSHYNEDRPYPAIEELRTLRDALREAIRPYAWIEAEGTVRHTFDEIGEQAGASNGRVLVVDKRPDEAPPAIAYYSLNVREAATYQLWVAASTGAPLSFRLDQHPLLDEAVLPRQIGAPYANGTLVWTRLGTATLPKGPHTIEMRADGPATVDVILLTRDDFTPDGANPPPVTP